LEKKVQKRNVTILKTYEFFMLNNNNVTCTMQITMRQFARAQEPNCLLNAHLIMLFCILH